MADFGGRFVSKFSGKFIPGGREGVFPRVPLFVLAGESNMAGYALNTDLTAGELAARPPTLGPPR